MARFHDFYTERKVLNILEILKEFCVIFKQDLVETSFGK